MNRLLKAVARRLIRALGFKRKRKQRAGKAKFSFVHDGPEKFEIEFIKTIFDDDIYYLPAYAQHRPAVRRMLGGEIYEPETHKLIRKIFSLNDGSMIHAGTFFGDMLPSFASSVSGTVFAFEPVLENYVLARLVVEANRLENVRLYHAALSNGQMNLRINSGVGEVEHRGGASQIDDQGAICATLRIDDLEIQDLIVIQLDVEGHELNALQGAVEKIKKFQPIILIEDNKRACNEFLDDLGYQYIRSIPGLNIWMNGNSSGEYLELLS